MQESMMPQTPLPSERWVIQDWAGNFPFPKEEFASLEAGHEFLSAHIVEEKPWLDDDEFDDAFYEEIGEYEIVKEK